MQKYPEVAMQQVCIVPSNLRPKQPDRYVALLRPNIIDIEYTPIITEMALREYILLIGTYKQCQLMLRLIPPTTQSSRHFLNPQRWRKIKKPHDSENSIPATAWDEYTLSDSEYRILLNGLAKDDRRDRHGLWNLVSSQLSRGHPMYPSYLITTIYYSNPTAAKELLDRQWPVNGPGSALLRTPLDLAIRMEQSGQRSKIDIRTRLSVDQKRRNLEEIVKKLRQHGGKKSMLHSFLPWVVIIYAFYYLILLPLSLGLPSNTSLAQRDHGRSLDSRIRYMYLVSIMAMIFPNCYIFSRRQWMWVPGIYHRYDLMWIFHCVFIPATWIFNNTVLPYLVFKLDLGLSFVFGMVLGTTGVSGACYLMYIWEWNRIDGSLSLEFYAPS